MQNFKEELLRDKKLVRVLAAALIGMLLCLCVLTTVCVQCVCAGSRDEREIVYIGGQLESIEFLEDTYYMSAGSRLSLRMRTQPEVYDDVITWTSSDATVLLVDGSGVVTASGRGTAVITASGDNCSDSVTISVVDEILVEAADCVRMLSEGCDAYALSSAQLMAERLDNCSAEGAENVKDTISNIIAYTESGDRAALEAAIDASGMDDTLCRTAAACCWAYGEQQRCDAVLTFAGDCTLARFNEDAGKGRFPSLYEASGSPTYPFDRVKGIFACDDLTLINFEGTLTDSPKHQDKTFYFRGAPEYARMLPQSSVEAVTLANNHSWDYFQKGYDDTVRHLTDAGVAITRTEQPLTTSVGSRSIPVVMLAASGVGADHSELQRSLLAAIKEHKTDRTIVVVNLHWGVEGSSYPEKWQRDAAHELIDAGADLIVSHHPHVMQGIEIYNGKYIAYSLGNFAFGGNAGANSPRTYILRARLSADDSSAWVDGISVLPCRITSTGTRTNNYQPMLCFGADGDGIYSELIRLGKNIGGADAIDRPDI
ncbi:MAG: hypothetical protein E7554_00505 [Ruminococcaceae bacterium]|nr:hypothetical protein [Oscillospiraceae bacterium]